ncbi:NAD(P)-dependent oxidoreductase [Sporomusa aerivorans]|uniref:NAD(P)-dependent oxidoreductase n=1 Tax=Sporomusa aerivorans TaxID=204936 RepID=UPI00352B1F47
MKIAIIGATGRAGSRIVSEALSRNHEVTAIVRNTAKITNPAIKVVEKDILALNTGDLQGYDIVVNAFGAPKELKHLHVETAKHLTALLKNQDKPRLIIVGGAGSLFVDDNGTELHSTPDFPDAYKITATAMRDELAFLRTVQDVNWTFLSPSADFAPGERTGQFRLGKDHLLIDKNGNSSISMEDYSIALVDEIEKSQHIKQRFTVGY